MVEVTEEVLQKAKKALSGLTKDWLGMEAPGVCYGACWSLSGTLLQIGHGACHSWLGYIFNGLTGEQKYSINWSNKYLKDAEPFLVLNCYTNKKSSASKEATDALILWMASDSSPFSQFILNRDDPDHLTTSGPIILCGPGGATQAQVMWMCKVMRYTTEGGKALDVWHELYKSGVNPVLAVLVCSHISGVKGASFTSKSVSSHASVFYQVPSDLHDLMSFKFNPDASDTFSVFTKASKVYSSTEKVKDRLAEFCKPFVRDDGWGGAIKGDGATAEQLVEQVLKWQEELGGWFAGLPVSSPTPGASTVYLDVDM